MQTKQTMFLSVFFLVFSSYADGFLFHSFLSHSKSSTQLQACSKSKSNPVKGIPLDTDNFKYIREHKKVYIDKTDIIQQHILTSHYKYHFLARPRRWGKSLICSTLKEIFTASNSADLFQGLSIAQSGWDFEKESCPVIYLDMSRYRGQDMETVSRTLSNTLLDVGEAHHISFRGLKSVRGLLGRLIKGISLKENNGVVIIIDEYDAIIKELVMNMDPKEVTKGKRFHNSFYAALQSLDQYIRLVFVSGCLKFGNTFSKSNNFIDHTFEIPFNEICGYTEKQLFNDQFTPYITSLKTSLNFSSNSQLLKSFRKNFNGFTFGINTETGELPLNKVYNPISLNYPLTDDDISGDHWSIVGHSQFFIKQLIKAKFIPVDSLQVSIHVLSGDHAFTSLPVECLLYYAGYYTIKRYDPKTNLVTLEILNKSLKDSLLRQLEINFP